MKLYSDDKKMKSVLGAVIASAAWQQFTSNHGHIGHNGYTLPELVTSGVNDAWDPNRVNRCLDAIRAFAETGQESGSHNGSTYTARHEAIKQVWETLRAASLKDCFPRGMGGTVATRRHYYIK